MKPSDYLDQIALTIQLRGKETDKKKRASMLAIIMRGMANALRVYCAQQGNSCEGCEFVLDDPDRKNCECRINVGKNTLGTAPRFWELTGKRNNDGKEAEKPVQEGLSGQAPGMP